MSYQISPKELLDTEFNSDFDLIPEDENGQILYQEDEDEKKPKSKFYRNKTPKFKKFEQSFANQTLEKSLGSLENLKMKISKKIEDQ